jgi:hypothetical protein
MRNLIFAGLLLLAGCAGKTWQHPEPEKAFYVDHRTCMRYAKEVHGPQPDPVKHPAPAAIWRGASDATVNRCLRDLGWERR